MLLCGQVSARPSNCRHESCGSTRHDLHRCDTWLLCRAEHSLTAAVVACSAITVRTSNKHSGDALIDAEAPLTKTTSRTLCTTSKNLPAKYTVTARVFASRARRALPVPRTHAWRTRPMPRNFKPRTAWSCCIRLIALRSSAGLIGSCRIARHCWRKTIPSPPSARSCNETKRAGCLG